MLAFLLIIFILKSPYLFRSLGLPASGTSGSYGEKSPPIGIKPIGGSTKKGVYSFFWKACDLLAAAASRQAGQGKKAQRGRGGLGHNVDRRRRQGDVGSPPRLSTVGHIQKGSIGRIG